MPIKLSKIIVTFIFSPKLFHIILFLISILLMNNLLSKEIIREEYHGYILFKENIRIEEFNDKYYEKNKIK